MEEIPKYDERIDAIRSYRHKKINFDSPIDYINVCTEADELLSVLGEEGVKQSDLRGNGRSLRHFITSLRVLKNQLVRMVPNKDIIEIMYEESQRHASEVEAELNYFLRNR